MELQQLLQITPANSIKFEGTFKEIITKKLSIKNPTDKYVAFKIKTTTPKQYCVRPSIGFVSPQQSKEISIILQPMQYSMNDKAKHKFMIQSLVISEEESTNIDLVWKNAAAGDIMCTKLLSILVQTAEVDIKPEADTEKETETVKNDLNNIPTSDMISSVETLEAETLPNLKLYGVSEVGDVSMVDSSINYSLDDKFEKMVDENIKLKEQVESLKKLVFEQTYKLETQTTTEPNNLEKDNSLKDETDVRTESIGQLGIPLIIYQLMAFFLGLIIGKFFL